MLAGLRQLDEGEMMLGVDWFASAQGTLLHLHRHLTDQKQRAEKVAQQIDPVGRGYFTAAEDDEIQAMLVSYLQTRQALFDLIQECRVASVRANGEYDAAFLVAFAAACLLVEAPPENSAWQAIVDRLGRAQVGSAAPRAPFAA